MLRVTPPLQIDEQDQPVQQLLMFKWINDKINLTFETEVAGRTDEIIALLKKRRRELKWYSFLTPGRINYKEFNFSDGQIEIRRMPNLFSPFRPFGNIRLTFSETSPTSTKVKCEVMPGDNLYPIFISIQIAIVLLWSALWVGLGWSLDILARLGAPLLVLMVVSGMSVLKIMIDRRSLIDYSDTVIKLMNE